METTQFKKIALSALMMDASQISTYTESIFVHKDGTQNSGMINLSGTYLQTPDIHTKVYGRNSFVAAETVMKDDGVTPKYTKTSAGTMGWIIIGFDKPNLKIKLKGDCSKLNDTTILNKIDFSWALGNLSAANAFKITNIEYTTGENFGWVKIDKWSDLLDNYISKTEEELLALYKTDDNGFFTMSDSTLGIQILENFCCCHAEGGSVKAIGKYAHAEGRRTIAGHRYSHAEGDGCFAYGQASHAEGSNTIASGQGAHAEGYRTTTASGQWSHAEGEHTTASGYASHTEGFETTASGSESHAEGNKTTASGTNSHAEGSLSVASGLNAHAEGGSKSYGNYSHAENSAVAGIDTNSSNYSAEKQYSIDNFVTIKNTSGNWTIYRCIKANGPDDIHSPTIDSSNEYWVYIGINQLLSARGASDSKAIGELSYANGQVTIAGGRAAYAIGTTCKAMGANSIATGNNCRVDASLSFGWSNSNSYQVPSTRSGTFNINPTGKSNGFYIGTNSLKSMLDNMIDKICAAANITDENKIKEIKALII